MSKANILNILYSKNKSPLEFQFDALTAPPLLSFITVQDIDNLRRIATSNRYSGKMELKYQEIDKIMRSRGFVKFSSGTNRVVYRPLESTDFVVKIALDEVGINDNPNEYNNQFLLKPFVTKVFEYSPCGTIASFERVEPITSRQEFASVAEDVFELLNNIIGEYVLDDIGSKYFMNFGTRPGFGIVILDFPYVFKLDGNKLYCNVPLLKNNGMPCGGLIDYDNGFNNLICTKCKKRYIASDLKKKESGIILCRKGVDMDMKILICKGNQVVRESEKVTDTIQSQSKSTYNTKKPRVNRAHELINYADTDIGTVVIAKVPGKKSIQRKEAFKTAEEYNKPTKPTESTPKIITEEVDTPSDNKDIPETDNKEVDTSIDDKALEALESYGLSDKDFEEPNKEKIEEKYSHLVEEYDDTTFEKIPKSPKQFY